MNVSKWSKKDLVQAWHMQRAKLEEQSREIKKLKKENDFIIQCPKCGEKIISEEMQELEVYSSAKHEAKK
jgi:predicted RNA-binding Zn-ribbon protein involved in translation (DUF1610 family)